MLSRGTPCLLADFDGNGFTDAAFLGSGSENRSPVVVLMFDEVGLSATIDLPKPIQDLALSQGAKDRAAIMDPTEPRVVFLHDGSRFRMGTRP